MTAAITFTSGVIAIIGGALLRTCNSGVEANLTRYWCGPQSHAFAVQGQAHCAGCAIAAAGLVLMIAAGLLASRARRRFMMERI